MPGLGMLQSAAIRENYPSAASIARAVWSPMLGIQCEYLSSVMAIFAWPSNSWTHLGGTFWDSNRMAQVWRRSCGVILGSTARSRIGQREPRSTRSLLSGLPLGVQNTSPESS